MYFIPVGTQNTICFRILINKSMQKNHAHVTYLFNTDKNNKKKGKILILLI